MNVPMAEEVFAARARLVRLAADQGWIWVDDDRFVSHDPTLPGWVTVGTVGDELLGLKCVVGSGWVATSDVEREAIYDVIPLVDTNELFQLVPQSDSDGQHVAGFAAAGAFLFARLEHLDDVLPTYMEHLAAAMRAAAAGVVERVAAEVHRVDDVWRPFVHAIVRLASQPDLDFVARRDASSATFLHRRTGRPMLLERDDDGSLIVLTYVVGCQGRTLDPRDDAVLQAMVNLSEEIPGVQIFNLDAPQGPGSAFAAVLDADTSPDEVIEVIEQQATWAEMCMAVRDLDIPT